MISIGKSKQKLLSTRLDKYMDLPGIYTKDIMSITNDTWDDSFDVVGSNKKSNF